MQKQKMNNQKKCPNKNEIEISLCWPATPGCRTWLLMWLIDSYGILLERTDFSFTGGCQLEKPLGYR